MREASAIADRFVAALAADDLAALAPLVGSYPSGGGFTSLGRILEGIDEPAISRVGGLVEELPGADGSLALRLQVAGTGVGAGNRSSVLYPAHWTLRLAPTSAGWQLTAAEPTERSIAAAALAGETAALDDALASHLDLDPQRFLLELVDLAAERGDQVEPAVQWAMEKARQLDLPEAEAGSLEIVSYFAVLRGDFAAADAAARQALEIAEGCHLDDAVAGALFARGVAEWFGGRIDEAIGTMMQAGALAEAVANPNAPRKALYMASNLEQRRGRLRAALAMAHRHEELQRRHPSLRTDYDGNFVFADIHTALGNLDIARVKLQRSIDAARAMGDDGLLAMALAAQLDLIPPAERPGVGRELDAVITRCRSTIDPAFLAALLRALGDVRAAAGDDIGAESAYLDSRRVAVFVAGNGSLSIVEQRLAALRLRQGRPEEALARADAALAAAAETRSRSRLEDPAVWAVLDARARALSALGQSAEAERAWWEAIDQLETWQAAGTADEVGQVVRFAAPTVQAPYRSLVDLLERQGRRNEALAIVERMRARALRDILERGKLDLAGGLTEDERKRTGEAERRLIAANRAVLAAGAGASAGLKRERDEARLQLRQLVSELELAHPPLRRLRNGLGAASSEELAGLLPAGSGVLLLLVEPEGVLELLMRAAPGGDVIVETFRVPVPEAELTRRVEELTRRIAARDAAFGEPARELHSLLLGPVRERLAGLTSLAVIPDEVLWNVPFQALAGSDGVPLIEQLAVFRAPSLAALRRRDELAPARPTLLAMGDPSPGGGDQPAEVRGPRLGPLPEARREVQLLSRLYGEGSLALVGGDARERAFKERARDFTVIHLATHGLIDDHAPLYSALLLAAAEGDGEDGLLEAREIIDLPLRARLVVLSACETARGSIQPGEGVVGMWWALMAAGVPTTVVSDWTVDSTSTEELMVRLHRQLLAGRSPAEAIRQAQLAVRRLPGRGHPYYWAAFGVVGAGW